MDGSWSMPAHQSYRRTKEPLLKSIAVRAFVVILTLSAAKGKDLLGRIVDRQKILPLRCAQGQDDKTDEQGGWQDG
jgi:hypothetical protein